MLCFESSFLQIGQRPAFIGADNNTLKREPRHIYLDPLDAIWLTTAERIGFAVKRSAEVFASTDGRGTMTIGAAETLDPDDCVAQMVLHELCHSLIEGAQSLQLPDFGLDNEGDRDVTREHACLRLQASLTGKYGLRTALAPTTDFRRYYDDLPEDPFAGEDPAIQLARKGAARSDHAPWAPHLFDALEATAQVMAAARRLGASRPGDTDPPIWSELER